MKFSSLKGYRSYSETLRLLKPKVHPFQKAQYTIPITLFSYRL